MVAGTGFDEQPMTLVEAARWLELRFGRRPNTASVWRWATKGIKGVRLATISLGRYRYTTVNALERFIAETSEPDVGREPVAVGRKHAPTAEAAPAFTKAEVAVANKRRKQEKEKALAYLRSRLGGSTRKDGVPVVADDLGKGSPS
jgi:hypothetical protein